MPESLFWRDTNASMAVALNQEHQDEMYGSRPCAKKMTALWTLIEMKRMLERLEHIGPMGVSLERESKKNPTSPPKFHKS